MFDQLCAPLVRVWYVVVEDGIWVTRVEDTVGLDLRVITHRPTFDICVASVVVTNILSPGSMAEGRRRRCLQGFVPFEV